MGAPSKRSNGRSSTASNRYQSHGARDVRREDTDEGKTVPTARITMRSFSPKPPRNRRSIHTISSQATPRRNSLNAKYDKAVGNIAGLRNGRGPPMSRTKVGEDLQKERMRRKADEEVAMFEKMGIRAEDVVPPPLESVGEYNQMKRRLTLSNYSTPVKRQKKPVETPDWLTDVLFGRTPPRQAIPASSEPIYQQFQSVPPTHVQLRHVLPMAYDPRITAGQDYPPNFHPFNGILPEAMSTPRSQQYLNAQQSNTPYMTPARQDPLAAANFPPPSRYDGWQPGAKGNEPAAPGPPPFLARIRQKGIPGGEVPQQRYPIRGILKQPVLLCGQYPEYMHAQQGTLPYLPAIPPELVTGNNPRVRFGSADEEFRYSPYWHSPMSYDDLNTPVGHSQPGTQGEIHHVPVAQVRTVQPPLTEHRTEPRPYLDGSPDLSYGSPSLPCSPSPIPPALAKAHILIAGHNSQPTGVAAPEKTLVANGRKQSSALVRALERLAEGRSSAESQDDENESVYSARQVNHSSKKRKAKGRKVRRSRDPPTSRHSSSSGLTRSPSEYIPSSPVSSKSRQSPVRTRRRPSIRIDENKQERRSRVYHHLPPAKPTRHREDSQTRRPTLPLPSRHREVPSPSSTEVSTSPSPSPVPRGISLSEHALTISIPRQAHHQPPNPDDSRSGKSKSKSDRRRKQGTTSPETLIASPDIVPSEYNESISDFSETDEEEPERPLATAVRSMPPVSRSRSPNQMRGRRRLTPVLEEDEDEDEDEGEDEDSSTADEAEREELVQAAKTRKEEIVKEGEAFWDKKGGGELGFAIWRDGY